MAKAFKAMKIAHGIVRNDREFAERLGVSLASVRNWSVGKRTIELQTLLPVCIFCQVRAHDFFAKDLSPICPPWACADDLTRIPARKVTKITDHFVSVLEESLITGDPSLSLKKRLEPYGYSSGTARSTYPELAQKIAKQRRDHLKKKRVEREEASVSKMRGLIFKQLPSEEGITLTAFLTNHPEFKSLNYQKCAAIFKKIMNERSERFSPGEEETKQSG